MGGRGQVYCHLTEGRVRAGSILKSVLSSRVAWLAYLDTDLRHYIANHCNHNSGQKLNPSPFSHFS